MINIGFIGLDKQYIPFLRELKEINIFNISSIFSEKIDDELKRFAEENNIYLIDKIEDIFSKSKIKLIVDTTAKKEIIHKLIDIKPDYISIIDIDVLKLLTESIKQKFQMEKKMLLFQKYETIGTLASGICHEMNNILMIIMGYAQLAYSKATSDISNYISGIINACERANRLIQQFSSFKGHKDIDKKKANIVPLIKETIKFVKETMPANIKIHLEVSPDIQEVETDFVTIRHAFLNIITNSQEAMPNGGDIYIKLANTYLDEGFCREYPFIIPGKYVCISIKDTGIGIPKEFLNRIFEPFFSTKDLGRGLGLSYAYGIIKQHGGYILVDSKPNKWTEFKIYLPIVEEKEEPQKLTEPKDGNATILIVEDDKDLLNMAYNFLKRSGYNILKAETATQAFDIIEEMGKRINLIITDFMLPDSFGSRVAYIAKKRIPEIKAILITGYQNNINKSEPDELFDMVIYKPISMVELTNKIYDLLRI